ncbi:MAG: non-homologous end-joining DNA ligase [Candidatus Babeliaceae bacterium]|nr:non-homologous end-joining DNA ligase [Candidatus Babeliaceae bacterium]
MNPFLSKLSNTLQKKLNKKKMPSFEKPMLATLTKTYFSDARWIFERKFDGERCLIFKNHGKVSLKSRNNKSLNATYPEIMEAAKKLSIDQIILDGEVVVLENGATSFEKLQQRLGLKSAQEALETGVKVHIYVFDILYLDGYELIRLPLDIRKSILKKAVKFKDPIRYTEHIDKKGLQYFKMACQKGWEGLIAKKRTSAYVHVRSADWLKFKCVKGQEFVIGGYTEPEHSRTGFGSLLIGYYEEGEFQFAGKVGTGFSDTFLKKFSKKLQKFETKKNPFASKSIKGKGIHFVEPHFIASIGFEEWTKNNRLRQPRFQGLRYDLDDPTKILKETPKTN